MAIGASSFVLARQISTIVPAEISVKSKSERGYDLVEGAEDRATMAQHPVLPPFPTAGEAFQTICGECLHHLISNRIRRACPYSRTATSGPCRA